MKIWDFLKRAIIFAIFSLFFATCATKKGIPNESSIENLNDQKNQKVENSESEKSQKNSHAKPKEFNELDFAQELSEDLKNGLIEEALKKFDFIPSEKAATDEMQLLKASLCFSAGHDEEAANVADEILLKNPQNIDALTLKMVLAKKGNDKKAKSEAIKKILAVDPKNADANVELAGEQVLRHKYGTAKNFYQTALESEPENQEALFGFAQMSYYVSKDEDAKRTFEKMLALDPQNATALAYLGKLEAEKGRYKNAKDFIDKAIEIEPNEASFHLDAGMYNRRMGKYSEAEKSWTRAIECDSEYFLGYAYRAGIYDEQDKIDLAISDYKKVVEKNPKYFYAYESIGILSWLAKNFSQARAAFLKALEYNPKNASYQLMVSATYLMEKNFSANKTFTENAMRTLDKNSLDYAILRLFHDRNTSSETPTITKIANEQVRSKKGRAFFYLGAYYESLGKKDLAAKYYGESIATKAPTFFEYRMAQWAAKSLSH